MRPTYREMTLLPQPYQTDVVRGQSHPAIGKHAQGHQNENLNEGVEREEKIEPTACLPVKSEDKHPIQDDHHRQDERMRNHLVPTQRCEQVDENGRVEIEQGVTPRVAVQVDHGVTKPAAKPRHTLLEPGLEGSGNIGVELKTDMADLVLEDARQFPDLDVASAEKQRVMLHNVFDHARLGHHTRARGEPRVNLAGIHGQIILHGLEFFHDGFLL